VLYLDALYYRSRYVYINFQVIISITQFFLDNILGSLTRDSLCIKINVNYIYNTCYNIKSVLSKVRNVSSCSSTPQNAFMLQR